MPGSPAPHSATTDASTLGRQDWVKAARSALVSGGIDRVKVAVLARTLGITRGSFYWHFTSRNDLLKALLQDWHTHNTAPFALAAQATDRSGIEKFQAIVDMWLDEQDYDPPTMPRFETGPAPPNRLQPWCAR